MAMEVQAVNIVALVVSAIASMGLGMLWYGPLFGRQWMALSGIKEPTKEEKDKMMGKMMPMMAAGFVASLIAAYVLAVFIQFSGAVGAFEGALTGFWVWLGFIATVSLNTVLWEGKPIKLYLLNNGHELVHFALIGIIIASMA
ncbi:MAG TPA: DUF1761 domain-containing protein [archaeon]|nr:DUF1761 domain-containing protein [archaeon]